MPPFNRVPIADGWTLWEWIGVRSAGFPAELVLELASPEACAVADELAARTATVAAARAGARDICERALTDAQGERRNSLSRALSRVLAAQPMPARLDVGPDAAEALATLASAEVARDDHHREAEPVLVAAAIRAGDTLRARARDGRFREAVTWQNRGAISAGVDVLLRKPAGTTDSKTRQKEQLVATYLQRYCVKNDSIGFFGPVGWGRFAPADAETIALHPAPSLLGRRTVYFEYWPLAALAALAASDAELRPFLVPRRMPTARIEGTTLHLPIERTTTLEAIYARVLAAVDGRLQAKVIAAQMLADPELELADVDEVYDVMSQLVDQRLMTWTIELAPNGPRPEAQLRDLCARAEAAAGKRMLDDLDRLDLARGSVAQAAGSAESVAEALGALDTCFTALTGVEPSRRAGETYAGRTLVYEDCQRDLEMRLGEPFLERFGPPLSLVLASARWYTYSIAARFRVMFEEVYQALRSETGSAQIDYLRFWARVPEECVSGPGRVSSIVAAVRDDLQARWGEILALPPDARTVTRTVDGIAPQVRARFDAPHPGWPRARHHSPDILVAARGIEAFRRGEWQLVLGELHTGVNTLLMPVLSEQHPTPSTLRDACTDDLPLVRVATVDPTSQSARADPVLFSPLDVEVEVGTTRSARPRDRVLAISDLVVEQAAAGLVVRTRDSRFVFDIIAFSENLLLTASVAHFGVLASAQHNPRVTLGGLVLSRERWRFEPEALGFASAKTALDRLSGARALQRAHGLPRFVFYKIPEELKPYYLDFDSPTYVDLFCKLVRRASSVALSEMLPAPHETWLVDAEARPYTSELRIAAVDPVPWRSPGAPEPSLHATVGKR